MKPYTWHHKRTAAAGERECAELRTSLNRPGPSATQMHGNQLINLEDQRETPK